MSKVDCGECQNITDGCSGLCEKIDIGIPRWSANWHMQEFYQSKHGDYVRAADYAVALSQLAALREELASANNQLIYKNAALVSKASALTESERRLADAERRNAAVTEALKTMFGLFHHKARTPLELESMLMAHAALNKPEEAKS